MTFYEKIKEKISLKWQEFYNMPTAKIINDELFLNTFDDFEIKISGLTELSKMIIYERMLLSKEIKIGDIELKTDFTTEKAEKIKKDINLFQELENAAEINFNRWQILDDILNGKGDENI
jgi:hypothetical protein